MSVHDFPASLDIDKLISEVKIYHVYIEDKDRTELEISYPPWLYKEYSLKDVKNIVSVITRLMINEIKDYGGGEPICPPKMSLVRESSVPENNTGGGVVQQI
jgi:hypothetical protein